MAAQHTYYEQANPDLLCRIPVTAGVVLEVGCGAGALGAAYKAINPDAIVVGLELMAGPAERARQRLDHVIEVNVENIPRPALPNDVGPVDCLVYGDVLEHLRDPAAVLQQQLEWLAPDGLVLACIPNVQHWSVLANLLAGQWPQQDHGLFDRTHLRWFTRAGMVELLQCCGLVIHDITPRVFQPERAQAFVQQLAPALPGMGIDAQQLLAGVSPLQYVVRASRKPAKPLLLSGLLIKPQAGMNEVRMLQPLRSVASLPGVVMEASHQGLQLLPASSSLPRVMIWERQLLTYEESLPRLQQVLAAGYVLVGEFDDDPARWPLIAANRNLNFTAMHAMQVSTERLAAHIGLHNPTTEVFSNAVEGMPEQQPLWPQLGDNRRLRLFFGALNRENDWGPWMETLNRALLANPDGWEVEVVHDRAFFDAISTAHKRFTPTCGYGRYRELMGQCHVAFLPLADNRFNWMKSDLKAVEAASHGLAILASPVVYSESLRDGNTGRLFRSEQELEAILHGWRAEPASAQILGEQARQWVRLERLQKLQSAKREQWYRSLWEQRQVLTEALFARVPELKGP